MNTTELAIAVPGLVLTTGAAGFVAARLHSHRASGRDPRFAGTLRPDSEREVTPARPVRGHRGRKTVATITTAGFFYLSYSLGAPPRAAAVSAVVFTLVLLWKTRARRA